MNLIPIIALVGGLLDWLRKTMEARKQSRELTPDEEAAYDEHIASRFRQPHWKPDEPS